MPRLTEGANQIGSIWKKGMKDGVPICLGYFAVSFTFGMLAVGQGLSVWEAVFISLTTVTSAGQFAGLTLIAAGSPYYEMAITQLIINLRYCLMSFALSQKLEMKAFFHRFLVAYGVTDEIFGVTVSQEGKVSPHYSYGAMSVAIPGWVLGTLAGAISGNLLPDFMVSALGIAIYGMFLAIIIPPATENKVVLKVVLGAMIMSGLFSFLPVLNKVSAGFVIIITTLLVAGAAAYCTLLRRSLPVNGNLYVYIFIMAGVTYLIRIGTFGPGAEEITSPFIKSFLFYVPYATLAAMTFPAILYSTASIASATVGFGVALFMAYKKRSLLTVALCACAAVFIVERIIV